MGFERPAPPAEFDWPAFPAPAPRSPCEPCEPRGVVPPPGVLPGDAESAPVKPRKCHGGESSTPPPLADCGRDPPPDPEGFEPDPEGFEPDPEGFEPDPEGFESGTARALLASAWSPLASDVENPAPPFGPDPAPRSGVNRVGWLVDANGSDGDPAENAPETLPGRGEPAKFAVAVAVAVPSEPTPKPYI